jgi:MFS family permease
MIARSLLSLRGYVNHLRFQRNAWLYLLSAVISGISLGVFGFLFNFYVKSLGYDAELIGSLLTVNSLAALLGALPAGYVSDRLGRKTSLLLSTAVVSLSVLGIVAWNNVAWFYMLNVLRGLAQSLAGVTLGPFLMENSRAEERTYLFSFNAGIQTIAASVANWGGGALPTWAGQALRLTATSAGAYAASIVAIAIISLLTLLPLALLQQQQTARQRGEMPLSPFQYALRRPAMLAKLSAPQLVTSLGAGLLIPFLNLFFNEVHKRPVAEVGLLFSWGSLAMGIGLLLAPPLAERYGKMRTVVVTQALSIPFLILLGFAPWYWVSAVSYLVRATLMNMSGPVYSAFVMEQAEPEARATVASLVNMSWSFGWTFSPTLSGWLQVNYGFQPLFVGTITTYVVAIWMYWRFFLRKGRGKREAGGRCEEMGVD